MLILQTDYDIFYVGGGFPPHFSVDALNHHFDDGYESSNFGGKLSECLDHFYQLAYFLVHLYSSFPLLISLLYYIDDNISIGKINNIDDNILFILYMDGNIYLVYNYCILE